MAELQASGPVQKYDATFLHQLSRQRGTAVAEPDAYNLGNLWRRLALAAPIGKWSPASLRQRLMKTG
jgi:hypothetical protein